MKPGPAMVERTRAVLAAQGRALPKEVVEKRTPYTKVFALGNGTQHVSLRRRLIHYTDDAGALQEIDTDITPALRVERAPYQALVLTDAIGYRYESRRGGWMQIELVTLDSESVAVPRPRREGHRVYWDDITGDVSMYFDARPEHPEIFKVYGSAPHTTVWTVTQSADFLGQFNPNTRGKDAAGDNLEILTTYANGVFTETWTGRVSRIPEGEKRRRKKEWFSDPKFPALVDAVITENIGAGADDVMGYTGFYPYPTIDNESLVTLADFLLVGGGDYPLTGPTSVKRNTAGFRFATVGFNPAADTLVSAVLTVNLVVLDADASPGMRVWGNDVDDAPAWSANNMPGQITKTTAFTAWDPTTTGVKQIDVTTVVTEIFARAGFASGNDVALIIGLAPVTNTAQIANHIEALEAAGTDEAQLDITYTEGAAAATAGAPQKARARTRGGTPRQVSPLRMQFDGRRRRGR